MLLDHKIIAGCGNIYACEALFRAGIHPARKERYVSSRKTNAFIIQEVLKEGIDNGGTSISDYRHADGKTENAITFKCIQTKDIKYVAMILNKKL